MNVAVKTAVAILDATVICERDVRIMCVVRTSDALSSHITSYALSLLAPAFAPPQILANPLITHINLS